ncbi:50S ribosomal protein L6 [Ceratobasidium theobromae]|uniref:50S ribosomal protein L6 n=1 Tax=Ceratobasidium theobromae TaxID=1582974 RepID=A0A5N5QIW2_9AGAM|nr:50S ribosomal protein L6 [Ceratobasidium theobromae]
MLRLARPRSLHPVLSRASHIGAAPIPIPPDLTLEYAQLAIQGQERAVRITGPRGRTSVSLPSCVSLSLAPYIPSSSSGISQSPYQTSSSGLSTPGPPPKAPPKQVLQVAVQDSTKKDQRALWGLTRALVANAVTGISRGFTVELNLVGVGYRVVLEPDPAQEKEKKERLGFKLGFAHWIYVPIPPGINAQVPLPTRVVLSSNDKHQLGQFAADIRMYRKPEPYKGKGIFVGGETIKLKDIKKK